MPECKLTYFNVMGYGEPIRFILSYMGKEFEDKRISFDEWAQYKEKTPFGKLPFLEINGKIIYQSLAILKYLATQAGLAGDNAEEELEINMVVGAFLDLAAEVSRFKQTETPSEKEKLEKKLINESIPFYMSKFESIVKKNGGYVANGKLSWADLFFVGFGSSFPGLVGIDLTEKYPFWKELTEKVHSLPGIKEWIKKRPVSQF